EECIEGLVLPAAPDDQVEVVVTPRPRPQERDRAEGTQPVELARGQGERRESHELAFRADGQQEETAASGVVPPPGVQPLPGEEEAIARAGEEKRVPFLRH